MLKTVDQTTRNNLINQLHIEVKAELARRKERASRLHANVVDTPVPGFQQRPANHDREPCANAVPAIA